jgi:hypothetical protein
MHNNSFFKQILLLVSILLFISCDKEYNVIGDGLISQNHFMLKDSTFSVVAYNQKITSVESENLPVNALGIYNNPAFGKTVASFATQVILSAANPIVSTNAVIDSVYLNVPYFTDPLKNKLNSDGVSTTYVLDSIYGASKAKIKLSVYESGYYMRDSDPIGGFQTAQKYFTDQNTDFNNLKIGNRLNDDSDASQNDGFFFNPAEHVLKATDATTKVVTTTRMAPSMRLKLNSNYFMNKIINAASKATTTIVNGVVTSNTTNSINLKTNDVFKNYFRGLYFKVEQSGSDAGAMAIMDFSKGSITISYTEELVATTGTTRVPKTIVLNFTGNTVSLQDQSNTNSSYSSAMSSANANLGDERLYLKGGEGSMAILDLFGPDHFGSNGVTGNPNGVADQLDIIRTKKWLINEANLVFNIDSDAMSKTDPITNLPVYEPKRIYLWDLNNRRPITDYYMDGTSGTNAKNGKTVFDGNINFDATSKRGSTYKIRITNHIRNLVKYADSTNVKLGIAVTESVNIASTNKWRNPKTATTIIPGIPNYNVVMPKWPDFSIETPKSSVMNPLGTILYGNRLKVGDLEAKRLKLQIYYTKPN